MSTFHLKVVTAEKNFYDGDVSRIVIRTSEGDIGILPGHIPYLAALGIGSLHVITEQGSRIAAIAGGFVDVGREGTTVLARTCEWADEINVKRAQEAADRAKHKLQQKASGFEHDVADIKLKKAVNRLRIAGE